VLSSRSFSFLQGALSVARFSEKSPTIDFASCELIIGKVLRWSCGAGLAPAREETTETLLLPFLQDRQIDERENKKTHRQIAPLVSSSDKAKQRARSRAQSFSIVEPKKNCALAKAFSRTQQTSQSETVSVRHVDVELLYQPRRQKSSEKTPTRS